MTGDKNVLEIATVSDIRDERVVNKLGEKIDARRAKGRKKQNFTREVV